MTAVEWKVSMHLLVLSAFRRWDHKLGTRKFQSLNAPFGAQCFPTENDHGRMGPLLSQCTFWCSVLSDFARFIRATSPDYVSMHLLVLSAFRPGFSFNIRLRILTSQCTFWCSVLSDSDHPYDYDANPNVSMHLLVLSAFRPAPAISHTTTASSRSQCTFWCSVLSDEFENQLDVCQQTGLNAPFGAQCFPTRRPWAWGGCHSCLNAPFGAQCFPTGCVCRCRRRRSPVSMHLLVLSAFRL